MVLKQLMQSSKLIHASVLIVLLACCAQAGPWPRKLGSGFVQLGFSTIGYDKIYNDASVKQLLSADVRDNVLQVFADYGVTADLTASVMVPFKFVSVVPISSSLPRTDNSGFGDIGLALRKAWLNQDGFVLSSEVEVGLPVGTFTDANGLYLGDGDFNVALRLLAGKSFYPSPFYISSDVAYEFRSLGLSDDLLYNVELGYGFAERRLYLIVLFSGRESTSMRPSLGPKPSLSDTLAAGLGLHSGNREYTAIIPKILYKFDPHWGIVGSWATAVHGRNVAGGFVFAGGVFYEF